MNRQFWVLVTACAVVCAATSRPVVAADSGASFKEEIGAGLEEIFIFRTTRTARTRGATPFCKDAGFESVAEDVYALWSMKTDTKSGRLSATHVRPVGEFNACFGATAVGKPFSMHARGVVGGVPWTGNGECMPMAAQPPVSTVRTFNCNLALSGLPEGYVGGWGTSSTAAPILGATAPPDAHVRGYLSTSIVILRLWKNPVPVSK